jgi:myo-inositol 2-dehydrogenase/D-chiro-inositol 1-dehydrogenase
MATVGVGLLGAGPVTQAIHLPAIATLGDRLRVAHVMDVDAGVAAAVAGRVGARHTTDVGVLLDDPAVDVVAICSPHRFHAEQVEAACAAGKRAILCEKPLAIDPDGRARIVRASTESGVPVIVGTMHVYDPAVGAASRAWGDLPDTARFVRSITVLPPNDRFVELSTELHASAPAGSAPADVLTDGILGLATHDLPLVRRFVPAVENVTVARALRPWGYEVTFTGGGRTVQMLAAFHAHWRPDWTLTVWGDGRELRAEFPPSYVLGGSAAVTLRGTDGEQRWRFDENGYQAEWRHVADVATGRAAPAVSVQEAAADLDYALALAGAATGRAA